MASELVVGAVSGLAGVVITKGVEVWQDARRDRRRDHARELERARDDLLVQLATFGRELDKLEESLRGDVRNLDGELKQLRDRLAGVEGLVRGYLDRRR